MSDTPYQPIACADYDVYEIAIMQGHLLVLKFRDDSDNNQRVLVKPLTLEINEGGEYLYYEASHSEANHSEASHNEARDMQQSKIRLDRIQYAQITHKNNPEK